MFIGGRAIHFTSVGPLPLPIRGPSNVLTLQFMQKLASTHIDSIFRHLTTKSASQKKTKKKISHFQSWDTKVPTGQTVHHGFSEIVSTQQLYFWFHCSKRVAARQGYVSGPKTQLLLDPAGWLKNFGCGSRKKTTLGQVVHLGPLKVNSRTKDNLEVRFSATERTFISGQNLKIWTS